MKNYPYEITTINCNICKKTYLKAKASYIENEGICFDCFTKKHHDNKHGKTIDNLFKQITDETSYILGRLFIPFVWGEAEETSDEIISLNFSEENINSVNLLKLMVLCSNVTCKKIKTTHVFEIYKKDIEDLMSAFNFQKIKLVLKTEENMNLFLRGIIEQYSLLITSEMILEINPRSSLIIKYLLEVNGNNNKMSSDSLVYEKLNCMDFLGKIYKSKLYLVDNWFYGQYNLMNDTYSSSKTKFSYCKVLKSDDNAVIPFKTNLSDIGFDLTIIKKVKDLTSNTTLYDTGIIVDPPKGFYVEIHPRSSLSKSGYMLANSTGIIDPGYRNTLMIALTKTDVNSPDLQLPFKCCQMIIKRHEIVQLVEVADISSQTSRGLGGFGSTG